MQTKLTHDNHGHGMLIFRITETKIVERKMSRFRTYAIINISVKRDDEK